MEDTLKPPFSSTIGSLNSVLVSNFREGTLKWECLFCLSGLCTYYYCTCEFPRPQPQHLLYFIPPQNTAELEQTVASSQGKHRRVAYTPCDVIKLPLSVGVWNNDVFKSPVSFKICYKNKCVCMHGYCVNIPSMQSTVSFLPPHTQWQLLVVEWR